MSLGKIKCSRCNGECDVPRTFPDKDGNNRQICHSCYVKMVDNAAAAEDTSKHGVTAAATIISRATDIPAQHFSNLKSKTKIILPEVETIGSGIAVGSNIEVLDIGPNLKTIKSNAFVQIASLGIVMFRSAPAFSGILTVNGLSDSSVIYVPDEYVTKYKTGMLRDCAEKVQSLKKAPIEY